MKYVPFVCVILFWICSCSSKNNYDDNLIFRLNRYDNISSLDPAFARTQANNWACNLMYNSLVRFDDSLRIEGDIAKEWQISEDAKTYTFTLRKNVFFHKHAAFGKDSTRQVVAKDFVYSFNRLTDTEVGGSGAWVMNKVEAYRALNDSTFQIQLKEAFPAFLGLLSTKYCSVVPEELFDAEYDFAKTPIGTGPFAFAFWEDNVKLVLRKNALFWEQDDAGNTLPYLEAVNISFLPEKHSAFLQLTQGNLDMLADLDPSYKDEILTAKGKLNPKYSSTIRMQKSPYLSTVYFCFYLDDEKPIHPLLRQAISMGIDKERMITYLMNGIGSAGTGGFIPKGLAGYDASSGYTFDAEEAKKRIAQYKQEVGALPEISLTTVAEYTDLAEYAQSQLAKIGLSLAVNVVPGPTIREGKATGKFAFFRANWGADYPDAENFLSLFYSKNFAPNGPNYSHYINPEFDALYTASATLTNDSVRAEMYKKMDALMMQDAPVVPMMYDETVIFLNKKVKGFSMSPIKLLDLKRVRKTD